MDETSGPGAGAGRTAGALGGPDAPGGDEPDGDARTADAGRGPVRSLASHTGPGRRPRATLLRLLEHTTDDMPPDGPEGPVARLERRVAGLLGKEAALFFPSGTMAQQTALRVHAERRGRHTFAAHPQNHLDAWEAGGYQAVHGLRLARAGDRHALMTEADLAAVAEPLAAVVWELPQREIGGLLPEWADLCGQTATARARGAATHLDGARLWEAQPYYARPFAEICELFDSVYVSLYKGLQGVRGAVLAADAATIGQAAVWRHRLGGALPDAWPLALAGLAGLDTVLPRMPLYREHAHALADALNTDGAAHAWPEQPQTPMFHVHLPVPKRAADEAAAALVAQRGVRLFGAARTVPDPRRCVFEVSVGEDALGFAPKELAALVRELVERARAGT